MKKTEIEIFISENSLMCEITITEKNTTCAMYKDGDLYIKIFESKTLKGAIVKAIEHQRRLGNDSLG